MKKIIDLIKKLLSGGSSAEKVVAMEELQVEVKQEIEEVKEVVAEVKAKVKKLKAEKEPKVKKTKVK
jgi:cell division protein FtsB